MIRETLGDKGLLISLLRSEYFARLVTDPSELRAIVEANYMKQIIVIDEVQKVPQLLDEVHYLIEEQ